MEDRIHRALDGDIPPEDLSPQERADLDEWKELLHMMRGAAPDDALPDIGPSVLARIENLPASDAPILAPKKSIAGRSGDRITQDINASRKTKGVVRAAMDWLWRPRPTSLTWRPVYVLAAAVVLVLALLLIGPPSFPDYGSIARETNAVTAQAPQVLVQFRLDAPQAHQVQLAGSFTDWQPAHTLMRSESGIWTVVVALEPGIHNYSFIVDGDTWIPDPMAPAVGDGFGGLNSRIAVLLSDQPRPL